MRYLKTFESHEELSGELRKLQTQLRIFIKDTFQLKEMEDVFTAITDMDYKMTCDSKFYLLTINFRKELPDVDVEQEFDQIKATLERRRKYLQQEYGFKTQYEVLINHTKQNSYNSKELSYNILQYQGYKPNGTGNAKVEINFYIV